ncbi:universal stress protein [Natrialba asiatica]|uniref:UpsA domain-containing protein n=1 Tax=Natrialba asiatica (strain ATCC 700177 / DSM 12278 / JCM 9576 / FERM P-10747 / NBRC 102637 / 172P1) TaxID=29540 RepID=M0B708_NATA1|nr:universal stress protein [Natrialba asiatica]ELZ06028.1 UpsA domain-containing protein [Natrialba asiatica DSM 12278]
MVASHERRPRASKTVCTGLVVPVPTDHALVVVAAEYDCKHVFIAGDKRSPTGKALFGDEAQSVLLHFDGPVTALIGYSPPAGFC